MQNYALQIRSDGQERRAGLPLTPPVDARLRVWYNSTLESSNYIVPGLIAAMMMVIAALLTSLTIAREWEMGTMEQLLSTPVRPPKSCGQDAGVLRGGPGRYAHRRTGGNLRLRRAFPGQRCCCWPSAPCIFLFGRILLGHPGFGDGPDRSCWLSRWAWSLLFFRRFCCPDFSMPSRTCRVPSRSSRTWCRRAISSPSCGHLLEGHRSANCCGASCCFWPCSARPVFSGRRNAR